MILLVKLTPTYLQHFKKLSVFFDHHTQLMQENCKPMFEQLFDDIEVIEGSAAKFECVVIGTPDPEIMWFKDGEPLKESRHYQ